MALARGPAEASAHERKFMYARSICTLPMCYAAPRPAAHVKPVDAFHGDTPSRYISAQPAASMSAHSTQPAHALGPFVCGSGHAHRSHRDSDQAEGSESPLPFFGHVENPAFGVGSAGSADCSDPVLAGRTSRVVAGMSGLEGRHACASNVGRDAAPDSDFSFWPHDSACDFGPSTAAQPTQCLPFLHAISLGIPVPCGQSSIRLSGCLKGIPLTILIDSGAERDCVSQEFLDSHHIPYLSPELEQFSVRLPDGRINRCGILDSASFSIDTYTDCSDFAVTDLEGEDLILGMPWLHRINPSVDWQQRMLTFVHSGKSHVLSDDPTESPQSPLMSAQTRYSTNRKM